MARQGRSAYKGLLAIGIRAFIWFLVRMNAAMSYQAALVAEGL